MSEFSLITAEVRKAILNEQNSFPFIRSEIGYAGFRRYGIAYRRQPRVAGKTHYNLVNMTIFATAGLLTSSTLIMRLAAYIWPLILLFNVVALAWDSYHGSSAGFRAAVLGDLFYLITFLTALGLYIARIYKNGIGRPNFIVNHKASLLNRAFADSYAGRSILQMK